MAEDPAKNSKINKDNTPQPRARRDSRLAQHGPDSASFDQDLSKWEADSMHNVKDEIMRHAFPSSF